MKILISLSRIAVIATALLVNQAYAATPFSPVDQPLGFIGPIELSNSDLSGGVKAYRGWFENGGWQGDLIEYDVSPGGGLTTSIDLTGTSPVQTTGGTNWSAYLQFDAADDDPNYWDTGRKIVTSSGHDWPHQTGFRWTDENVSVWDATVLTPTQRAEIGSEDIYEFIRGNRAKENPNGTYRARFSLMGDIIHSKPHYVGVPDFERTDPTYVDFVNANLNRAPRVYVGANDGMMHAFDAATGEEAWAYVPSHLFSNLSKLASRPFSHTYFVDGGTTVGDARFPDGVWHTILLGGLGSGAKGLYALDVTNPDISDELSVTGYDRKVHFEFKYPRAANNNVGDDLGYIMGTPIIAKTNFICDCSSTEDQLMWYGITGNGYGSVNGVAKLLIVRIDNGNVRPITAGTASNNGLSAPAVVDVDNNGTADIVYAGDLNGDLWRFDITSALWGDWENTPPIKIYDGDPSQPITTAPDVTTHPVYGHMVIFGTGKLYTVGDKADTSTQALIGIWDKGVAPAADVKLAQLFSDDADYSGGGHIETVRTITTDTAINWATHTGWIANLKPGERVITPVQLRSGRVKATVHNPIDSTNWLVEVAFADGGIADQTIYDLNRDSVLNEADRVDGNLDTFFDSHLDIPMAWQRRNGNLSRVTIARIGLGVDTMFFNFLNPVLVPPSCTGTCAGGLSGGHMDVDTDKTLGGGTDVHKHEYDDKTNLTYVDYFNPQQGLDPVTSAGIGSAGIGTDEFIITIANADFSPGATLTIGNWQINVVEYQRLLHKAMAAWNGKDDLIDATGRKLSFTLADLTAGGGTLRTTMDSLAIVSGGLHPTNTGCVKASNYPEKGRWRNGALTIQLLRYDHFWDKDGYNQPLDRLVVQNPPDDMRKTVVIGGQIISLAEDLSDPLDGDTDDEYEVYGGMVAANNTEFLYESTLFWHYKGGGCYGSTNWEQDVMDAKGIVSEELFYEMVKAAGFTQVDALGDIIADLDALVQAFNALEASGCGAVSDKDGGCKKEYEALLELIDLSKKVVDENGDPIISTSTGSGLEGAGTTPVVIEGAITNTGVTSGPNFTTGRRTWIDILPAE